MKVWKAALLLGLMAAIAAGTPVQAKMVTINGKQYDIAEPGEFKPGEVIVRLKSDLPLAVAQDVAALIQGKVKKHIPEYNLALVALPTAVGKDQKAQVEEAVAALEKLPQVAAAYPNFKMSIPKPPELDPSPVKGKAAQSVAKEAEAAAEVSAPAPAVAGFQWHLNKVRYHQAGTPPASAPTIAIIDTGVDYLHPDLKGKVLLGKDFVDSDNDPMDENGHGTHCAGIAAGTGAAMVQGISPTSKILAVRVLDQFGSGWTFDIMQGIIYARNYSGVKILSCSFGGYLQQGSAAYLDYKKVFDDTVAAGKIVCAAAGNDANLTLFYYQSSSKYRPVPAWYPTCFTVGATNEVTLFTYFSNYDLGTAGGVTYNYAFVDIVAPGWQILSSYLDGQAVSSSGTSMSTPLVAGAAARVWAKYPAYTLTQVQSALVNYGTAVTGVQGFPSAERRVDLMKALGLSATGFVGQVLNGQTGKPLSGATVKAFAGTTLVTSTTTNQAGMFVITGLTGGTNYRLNFTKTGFGAMNYTAAASAGNILDLPTPMVMPQLRPAGQWSITIKWRSWQPGYYDAYYSYPSKASWYPYYWYDAPGTFFAARLAVPGYGLIYRDDRGYPLGEPYAYMTTDAWDFKNPVTNFIITQVKAGTYKIWTRLDNINDDYYEWGKYKTVSGKNLPAITAYIYQGSTLKGTVYANSATGTGAYWYIGDITGSTFTAKNLLQATQP